MRAGPEDTYQTASTVAATAQAMVLAMFLLALLDVLTRLV